MPTEEARKLEAIGKEYRTGLAQLAHPELSPNEARIYGQENYAEQGFEGDFTPNERQEALKFARQLFTETIATQVAGALPGFKMHAADAARKVANQMGQWDTAPIETAPRNAGQMGPQGVPMNSGAESKIR